MSATKIPETLISPFAGRSSIPVMGMGTATVPSGCDATKSAVIEAIKQGYRHFDTAPIYMSEHAVGEAIAEALKLGFIVSRDDIFITSKLWVTDNHPDLVIPALQKSLRSLQLEYVDLYLIHWPTSVKPGTSRFPYEAEDVMPLDLKGVWRKMEECQKLGLTKSIGVSNFSAKKLEALLSLATIPPSVNEVEMNPTWQQMKLREFCKEKGIVVLAYSPLGSKGAFWGTDAVMDNEILKEIAEARGKSVAQVSLRWLYEQGVAFVVKSYNKERMKQNLEIFDWTLTENDYNKINQIQQLRISNGPAPSVVEDLWDGET